MKRLEEINQLITARIDLLRSQVPLVNSAKQVELTFSLEGTTQLTGMFYQRYLD